MNTQTIPRFAVPYDWRDYVAALGSMFRQRPVPPEGFRKLLGAKAMFWTSSGRQALWLILRSLNLPPASGVAVPLYCDVSVHAAIRKAGCKPVFVDIDPRNLVMDPASLARVRNRVSAVVLVHYFGHMAAVDRLLEIADCIPVIEDTAHSPLSTFGNRQAGDFGLASFYSFASTKYWPAGGGGLAVINDSELAGRVAGNAAGLTPPGLFEELRGATGQAAKALLFRRPLYGLIAGPLRARLERFRLLEPGLERKAIQRSHAVVALRQAERFALRVQMQRANSLRLLSHLSATENVVLPFESPGACYNYHLFPVLLRDPEEREAVSVAMRARHVDTSQIHFDAIDQARRLGYRGGCPVSESAASRMLTLPNYAGLSDADVGRVASVFLDSLNAHRLSKCQAGRDSVAPRRAPVEVTVR